MWLKRVLCVHTCLAVHSYHVHCNCLTTCTVREGHVVSVMCVDLFKVLHIMSAEFSASVVRLTYHYCCGIEVTVQKKCAIIIGYSMRRGMLKVAYPSWQEEISLILCFRVF